MALHETHELDELAARVVKARVVGFIDLYLERVFEVTWEVRRAHVAVRRTLAREGAAVRRKGAFASSDGLDRLVLADLLGVSARALPLLRFPSPPSAPPHEEVLRVAGPAPSTIRWRWSWGAVVRKGRCAVITRPQLLEIAGADGHRELVVWPPPADWKPLPPMEPGGTAPRAGPTRVLLGPAAAAVLVHEMFGHALEADLLAAGHSPFARRFGARVVPLAVDLDDDPTAPDLPGGFSADDEGVGATRRPLLAGGVLVGALTDRARGVEGQESGGNARRASVHDLPRPRISNLVMSGAHDGSVSRRDARIEIETISSGVLEPRSTTVMLAVRSAWSLHRGARVHPLAPFRLVGTVDGVCRGLLAAGGDRLPVAAPGWCGKEGEVIATGARTPSLLVEGLEIR